MATAMGPLPCHCICIVLLNSLSWEVRLQVPGPAILWVGALDIEAMYSFQGTWPIKVSKEHICQHKCSRCQSWHNVV